MPDSSTGGVAPERVFLNIVAQCAMAIDRPRIADEKKVFSREDLFLVPYVHII